MKIDLPHPDPDVRTALEHFKSPDTESSVFKGVPLSVLSAFKSYLREYFPGLKVYVKYRGPRQSVGTDSGTCLKKNATSAAIYFRGEYRTLYWSHKKNKIIKLEV